MIINHIICFFIKFKNFTKKFNFNYTTIQIHKKKCEFFDLFAFIIYNNKREK